MTPETEKKILRLLDLITIDANDVERDARNWGRQVITRLSRIDDALAEINRKTDD